jgi:tetratricopeptide (TPR) repeat protein
MKKIILVCAAIFATSIAFAQISAPQPSPLAKSTQTVGLTEVSLEYSRPAMKGRTIFGDLVPYNQLWRTGANANSIITFSDDITFAGTAVKAGSYAIYTKPGESKWEVMLYSDTSNWGTPQEFDDAKVAAKATVDVKTLRNTQESFTIGINELSMNGAHLQISWDKAIVAVPFTVPTAAKTLASIDKVMKGPAANDYYSAATFYLESGKDLKQAREWIGKAVELNPTAYWMLRKQSLIEAELGDKKAAIAAAKKSLELATKANNMDYVKLNKDSLAEWGVKM